MNEITNMNQKNIWRDSIVLVVVLIALNIFLKSSIFDLILSLGAVALITKRYKIGVDYRSIVIRSSLIFALIAAVIGSSIITLVGFAGSPGNQIINNLGLVIGFASIAIFIVAFIANYVILYIYKYIADFVIGYAKKV